MRLRSGRVKVTAFAGADEQKQALDAWRAKTNERSAKVADLKKQIANHKKQATRSADRARWLADRESLNREQDACEEQLARALHPLLPYFREDVVAAAAVTQRLRDTLHDALTPLKGSTQALSRIINSAVPGEDDAAERARDVVATARAHVAAARALLASKELESEANASVETETDELPAAMAAQSTTVDFTALFDAVEARHAQMKQQYAGAGSGAAATAVLAAFAQALASERERCRDRLGDLQAATAVSSQLAAAVGPAVISSIALMLKMSHNARRGDITGQMTSLASDAVARVSRAFPALSRAEVDAAIAACQQSRYRQEQERFIAGAYRKATTALLDGCETALRAEALATMAAVERADEQAKRAQATAERQEQLAVLRAAHTDVQRMRAAEEARAQAVVEEKRAAQAAVRMAEMQERMDRLGELLQARAEARQREAEVAAMRAAEEAEQRAAEAEHNKERVAFRQRELEKRQVRRHEKERELAEMAEARQRALERFFAAVDRDLGVQPSQERLLQATEAGKQATAYVSVAQMVSGAPRGYTDDQIMRDPRVRLYHALMEAGLHTTPYGREVATRGFHVAPAQRTSEDSPFS